MKNDIALIRRGGRWRARVAGRRGPIPVCTITEASGRLGRSRRHLYRWVAAGTLPAIGKAFGEVLVDEAALERLAGAPKSPQRIPARLAPLFPEYDLARLNVGRDRSLIVTRVLDRGGLRDARWLARRLPRPVIARCLEADGARLMSPRSLSLWALVFGVRPRPLPAWRRTAGAWR